MRFRRLLRPARDVGLCKKLIKIPYKKKQWRPPSKKKKGEKKNPPFFRAYGFADGGKVDLRTGLMYR
jgi:hypothetical protein